MGWNHITLLYQADLSALSHIAICVLHVLAKTADENGQSYPSTAYIADRMKISPRSVIRALQELAQAGLVLWRSGRGNRHVNHYQLNVDNLSKLSTNVTGSHIKYDTQSYLKEDANPQIRHTVTLNMTHSHIKYDTQSQGRVQEDTNKLVSMYPTQPDLFAGIVDNSAAGSALSAEDTAAKPVPERAEVAPAAPAVMQAGGGRTRGEVDYRKLVKTYGWKPKTKKDIEAVWSLIYAMGASRDEADRFIRHNSARKWNGVGETCSVKMLAHLWIDKWKERDFEGYCEERRNRIEAKRRADEEKRLRAAEGDGK